MKIKDIIVLFESKEKIKQLPLINIKDDLYHVGSMDISKRKNNSYEGRGLSISTAPDAWRSINRGNTTGDTYQLIKPNNSFIDMHKISKKQFKKLYAWGIDNGYLKNTTVYTYTYYDDEMDQDLSHEFVSYEKLLKELDIDEDEYTEKLEYGEIEVNNDGVVITDKFKTTTGSDHLDLIVSIYAQENKLDIDGLYWRDKLDIRKYSAPRGVIFDDKLSSWVVKKLPTK